MDWLNIESLNELVEIMHENGRLMPGHQPMPVSAETRALIRAVTRPLSKNGSQKAKRLRAKSAADRRSRDCKLLGRVLREAALLAPQRCMATLSPYLERLGQPQWVRLRHAGAMRGGRASSSLPQRRGRSRRLMFAGLGGEMRAPRRPPGALKVA
jgi:hypothetical protein